MYAHKFDVPTDRMPRTEQSEFKIKLVELKSGLLKQLAEAEGELTENIVLIESLEEAMMVSMESE
jgi:dynein heavy chain